MDTLRDTSTTWHCSMQSVGSINKIATQTWKMDFSFLLLDRLAICPLAVWLAQGKNVVTACLTCVKYCLESDKMYQSKTYCLEFVEDGCGIILFGEHLQVLFLLLINHVILRVSGSGRLSCLRSHLDQHNLNKEIRPLKDALLAAHNPASNKTAALKPRPSSYLVGTVR